MLFRCIRVVRPLALHTRGMSMRTVVIEHGVPLSLYYFVTNELLVCLLTCLLHYGYFGQEDLIGFLKSVGASKYVDLNSIEGKSWSLFGGQLVVSARLVANFTAASLFMSLWTPVQLPICIATYPYLKRFSQRLMKSGPVSKPI
ncbi:conserved hypothetical protein [Leishmania mexicana MHOM/GT/2001/U1103]|uniref:Uncharacterized protein n=1 Tax=Leishmania mexicana (strain MHOM/GT/2001/U1103) TaxID=929439 RepID=E9AJB8_LEIMU|nr:conserved hypothetical protein [Leishmania mexicana MHOM/GT/2001/U1103]CBZ23015.1 conserved hypothetical protein [Leishmania mexicana MHOM/GT/2001/U1103]